MKNRKVVIVVLMLVLALTLAACGGTDTKSSTPAQSSEAASSSSVAASSEASSEASSVEESVEASSEVASSEASTEAPAVEVGPIVKAGLGIVVELNKSKEEAEGKGAAQQDITYAVVGLDANGKIADVKIDVAQDKVGVEAGKTVVPAEFKTKKELGADYGMVKASGIKKEWNEQIAVVEQYMIGKTPAEVAATPVDETSVTTDADLLTGATIKLKGYLAAVAKAVENAKDTTGEAVKVGAQANTEMGHGTKDAADDKGASVQFDTTIIAVAVDKDGKVVLAQTDVAQNSVVYLADGKLETDVTAPGTTKQAIGADYGMIKASGIKKEWNEQADAFSAWTLGKTADEIGKLPMDGGKTTDADLLTSVTVTVDTMVQTAVEAINNAK